jgi:AraC-like DNA-binding protein
MDKGSWYEKPPFNITFPFLAWDSENVSFPPHWHNFFEIIFITKGGLYVSVDDTVYEASCGDVIMINSGTIHSFFDTKPKTTAFGFQFAITFFDDSFIDLRDIVFQNTVIGKSKMLNTLYAHVCRLLQDISREYHKKTIGYQLAIKSKLYELMLVILRSIPKVEHKKPSTKSKHIYDFILKNFDNPDLTLEEAANALNLNMFYFAHIFKKYMGYSFHSYLTTTRVNFAKRYLIESKTTITDIAFRSGFNSLQTFNRVFKNITGYTPGNYRRDNKTPIHIKQF